MTRYTCYTVQTEDHRTICRTNRLAYAIERASAHANSAHTHVYVCCWDDPWLVVLTVHQREN